MNLKKYLNFCLYPTLLAKIIFTTIYMEFKDFLIKYTTISKKFIVKEDYFEKYYDFLIDSEKGVIK